MDKKVIIAICFSISMLEHYILFSITDNLGITQKGRLQTNKIPLFTVYTHIKFSQHCIWG